MMTGIIITLTQNDITLTELNIRQSVNDISPPSFNVAGKNSIDRHQKPIIPFSYLIFCFKIKFHTNGN
jgi:hypothetical protein